MSHSINSIILEEDSPFLIILELIFLSISMAVIKWRIIMGKNLDIIILLLLLS